jgi:branched-chain amino acid aminotransferase
MTLRERVCWVDGRRMPAGEATVSVLAQSMQRGTLVFDTFAVIDTPAGPCGLGAGEHTSRFLDSAALMDLPVAYTREELLTVAGDLVRANPGVDTVRLCAFWGEPSVDLVPVGDRPSVSVFAHAWSEIHPAGHRAGEPARLTVTGLCKVPPTVLPVQAKVAASYAHAAVGKARALAAGFDDVLLLDHTGQGLAESGTLSFFLVQDSVVRTAPLDTVLDGVTRRVLLDLAADDGVPVEVGPLPRHLLDTADESFLTSTGRGVWPVGSIDGRAFLAPGPVSARLGARFMNLLRGEDPCAPRWLQPL